MDSSKEARGVFAWQNAVGAAERDLLKMVDQEQAQRRAWLGLDDRKAAKEASGRDRTPR